MLEIVGERGQSRDGHARNAPLRVARGEQIGDAVTVLGEPIERQGGPTTSIERHQRKPVLPGAEHRVDAGAAGGGRRSATEAVGRGVVFRNEEIGVQNVAVDA